VQCTPNPNLSVSPSRVMVRIRCAHDLLIPEMVLDRDVVTTAH